MTASPAALLNLDKDFRKNSRFDWTNRTHLPIFPMIWNDRGIPVAGRIPTGMLMGQGRQIQSLGQRILLIAVAIQGITPDPDDLASSRSVLVLCPALADDDAGRGVDDWPDDACAVPPLNLGWPKRQKAEEPRLAGLRTAPSPGPILPGDDPRLVSQAGIPVRFPRIIHALCRLIC